MLSKPGQGRYIGRENYGYAFERIAPREEMRRILERPVDRSAKGKVPLEDQVKKLQTELEIAND